jgi:hypothetical protein
MTRKLLGSFVLTVLSLAVITAAPAEARNRLFWWQHDRNYDQSQYDSYNDSDYSDSQDADVEEQFNQAQYELYMREMRHPRRQRYVESYYDPQYDVPVYEKPAPKKLKKKLVAKVAVAKPVVKALPASDKTIQTASLSKRFDDTAASSKVDCKKGASIVAGYGFSTVTTKSCTGATLVYGATRSGKNFEIQVSSASGELTTVKKL